LARAVDVGSIPIEASFEVVGFERVFEHVQRKHRKRGERVVGGEWEFSVRWFAFFRLSSLFLLASFVRKRNNYEVSKQAKTAGRQA
jgi:hypothetical protein